MYYNELVNLMLENLNEEQKKAVETTNGALLVLAGAGTGKTRVLTTRIAYILNRGLAQPWQVLALTFTNKAANEMKNRLAAFALDGGGWYAGDIWCGTFHSMCLRILRANSAALGLRRDFIIYGEDEQKAVLKSVFATMNLDVKDFNPADWVERISSIKDKGLGADKNISEISHRILEAYNAELSRLGAVDFGDIILKVLELFNSYPDILDRYQKQFIYVMVDEFQDVNNAQMDFLKFIMPPEPELRKNRFLLCVGDDDQSIYSWRGAEIKHILNFEKYYGNAKIIIDTNYRSTGNILGAANSLIAHNQNRYVKELKPCPDNGAGEPVYVLTLPSDWDEVRIIADAIMRKDEKEPYSNYAILIRAGSLSRMFEEEFTARKIPFKLIGAQKFYDRMEIRDVIAYLRLLVYPFDDMSFLRVIGKPRRGFGTSAIAKIRLAGSNLMEGLKKAELSGKQRTAADEFLSAFDFDWENMKPTDAVQKLLDASGYIKMWRESKDVDASDRLDNIKELITNVIAKYDSLPEFLEHAALMIADDNDSDDAGSIPDTVSIMTIHAAKGLEFDTVFLPAWEEGIFPNEKSVNEGGIEEERRLAYVAITRARRRAIITNAMSRMVFGQRQYNSPSRFITEMDNRYLDFQGGAPRAYTNMRMPTSYQSKPVARKKENISAVGKLVNHTEMGRGVVIEENENILTVAFRAKGIKKVAREFLEFID